MENKIQIQIEVMSYKPDNEFPHYFWYFQYKRHKGFSKREYIIFSAKKTRKRITVHQILSDLSNFNCNIFRSFNYFLSNLTNTGIVGETSYYLTTEIDEKLLTSILEIYESARLG